MLPQLPCSQVRRSILTAAPGPMRNRDPYLAYASTPFARSPRFQAIEQALKFPYVMPSGQRAVSLSESCCHSAPLSVLQYDILKVRFVEM